MVEADTQNSHERFYLDDLYVGQRFTSRTHVIDAAQINAEQHLARCARKQSLFLL